MYVASISAEESFDGRFLWFYGIRSDIVVVIHWILGLHTFAILVQWSKLLKPFRTYGNVGHIFHFGFFGEKKKQQLWREWMSEWVWIWFWVSTYIRSNGNDGASRKPLSIPGTAQTEILKYADFFSKLHTSECTWQKKWYIPRVKGVSLGPRIFRLLGLIIMSFKLFAVFRV